jgi:hypothetical protein
VQYERDERKAAAAILAGFDEVPYLGAQFRGGFVADQSAGALKDAPLAQRLDLGFHFLHATTESGRQPGRVEDGIWIAVKEHEDIPGQKRPDMAFNELCDRGPQDPFEVVQALSRPSFSVLSPCSAPTAERFLAQLEFRYCRLPVV